MRNLTIDGKEYVLEFTYEASMYKELVNRMFNLLTMSYIAKNEDSKNPNNVVTLIDGIADMTSDIPHVCKIAFHGGLLENHDVKADEAVKLMKQYMKENSIGFYELFEFIKEVMEEDGFFKLSGLEGMLTQLNEKVQEITPKIPQDHNKKQQNRKNPNRKPKSQTYVKTS